MNLSFARLLVGLMFVCVSLASAKDTSGVCHYLDPATVDLRGLLGDPPKDGSPETLQEIDLLLDLQKKRTAEQIARAKSEVKLSPFVFADVIGPWFTAQNLPLTAKLLTNLAADTVSVSEIAKTIWSRPRPPLQDKRIHPAVELPSTGSFPSSHAARGALFALVIAELAPDQREQILARGQLVAQDRLIGGVHFPSDVKAGQVLGKYLFDRISSAATFKADLAQAQAEFSAVRAHHQP